MESDPTNLNYRYLVELQKQVCWVQVLSSRLAQYDVRESDAVDSDERRRIGSLRSMADYQILLHLDRLWRFLLITKQYKIVDRSFGKSLKKISADIEYLRDKREHSEEYLANPRRQKSLTKEYVSSDAYILTPADWSSTIKGVRRLGGRLNVSQIHPAVEELYLELCSSNLWVLPWIPEELCNADF